MTDSASTVRTEVVVPVSVAEAFSSFTERLGDFKPPEHNILGVPIAETVLEPRVGGGIIDRGEDGSECRWARILAFEPPRRLVFSWDINPRWQIETRRRADQRGGGPVHRGRPLADASGTGTPSPRPSRTRVGRGP